MACLKWTLQAFILFAFLSGCDTAPTPTPGDDPAMQNATVKHVSPPLVPILETQAAVIVPQIPKRKDGRVFIPELGWLDEREFWEMYTNEAEKLPDSLDLYAVHLLRQEYEREREAEGET